MIFRRLSFFLLLFIISRTTFAAEWQWSVQIQSNVSSETNDHPRAFLWIPSDCKQVRGVVVGNHNMLEEGIFEHPTFRKILCKMGFAEIWITPGLDPLWDERDNPQQSFDEMMNSLAEVSGYEELKYAPIIPIGHSAYATFPWNFAAQNPDRTLAILSIHGDAPTTNLTGCGRKNPDWKTKNIDGIPGLMVEGEYEWWEARVQPALDYKKAHPKACVSFLCDAGHGHFDYSDNLVNYLCLFIEKAAKYRLPIISFKNKPVDLIPIDPEAGWLADRWRKDSIPKAKASPNKEYRGNRNDAFWYFDKEMVDATEKYYANVRGKKEQYIGFEQKGDLLNFNLKQFARYNPRFEPDSDGLTFHLKAIFTDSLRKNKTHEHVKAKPVITRICGPVEKVNDSTFTVRFYRMGLNSVKRTGDIWLIATSKGDAIYKSSVQQLNIRIPHRNLAGTPQQISFDSISNIRKSIKWLDLHAISNSGMPVYFYVREGPVEIKNGKLILTNIPPKAKFPVEVTVIAWQYGRSIDPKIQTAESVSRTFYIQQ
ncbi:MAG: hypothetical protein P4L34_04440 [Paludibacter sp.]|nr:hypothetical protein [Paludibacter sp.]